MPTGFSWDTFVHAKSCHCVHVNELFSGSKKWRKNKGHLTHCFNLGGTEYIWVWHLSEEKNILTLTESSRRKPSIYWQKNGEILNTSK